jgi:hypothetical protein
LVEEGTMTDLTPNQEEYFRILETLHPSPRMQRHIEAAKEDLRVENQQDQVVRGLTRVEGFTPNKD